MIRYENHCCDCAVPGYPCEGDTCPNINVLVYYCDICSNDSPAEYIFEDEHYCEECATEYLKEVFESLTVLEQAKKFNISLKRLED